MPNPVLIAFERLAQVKPELDTRIAELQPPIAMETGVVGDALGWALLFEHWPTLADEAIDPTRAFYNRYYWFKRFATLKQQRDGYDAGVEQLLFKILEQPGFDVDWSLLEQLDTEAAYIEA